MAIFSVESYFAFVLRSLIEQSENSRTSTDKDLRKYIRFSLEGLHSRRSNMKKPSMHSAFIDKTVVTFGNNNVNGFHINFDLERDNASWPCGIWKKGLCRHECQPTINRDDQISGSRSGGTQRKGCLCWRATLPFYLPEQYWPQARPTEDIDIVMEVMGRTKNWANEAKPARISDMNFR